MGMLLRRHRDGAKLTKAEDVAPKADKTKAELAAEAEAKGIKVPAKATKDEIRSLIEQAE